MRFSGEKLAVRLGIVGALQVVVLLLLAALAVPLSFYFQDRASPQGIVRGVQGALGQPEELQRRVTRLQIAHRVEVSIYDTAGQLVVSNVSPPLAVKQPTWPGFPARDAALGAAAAPGERGPHPGEPGRPGPWPPGPLDWMGAGGPHQPPLMVVPLRDGGADYTLVVRLPRLSPNYLPLVVIVLSAILVVWLGARLTARFITAPLERLSLAVGQFGAGELTARSDVARRDEVGLLASAFNQMADRIQSLRETERELLSNVAHELRTPLARIRVALEIAEESDGATAKNALLGINEDLHELESLIEDVFTATRLQSSIDSMGLVLRKGEVSVAALVHSVVSRFSANHPDRPLTRFEPAPEANVFGDEVLLRRALSNLLENAHKYTPELSLPIVLRVDADAERCVFAVEDAGIGVDPAEHAKVFLPFYRTEQSRSRTSGGVGLGLTLTKRIVEAHAGTIELDSALGKGTTVRVTLPAVIG